MSFVFHTCSKMATLDPAAEFLDREQETLAGLEDEFEFEKTSPPDVLTDDVDNNDDNIDDILADPVFNGGGGLGSDENGYEDIQSETTSTNGHMMPEPEKIRVWREEQKVILEQKDNEEAQRKEELKVQAAKEMEEWYARYADQLEKSKASNR